MGFMADDEYILLMESPRLDRHFTVKDMQVAHDAGVRTTIRLQHWQYVNPENGVWDWSNLDEHLENARIAGLKTVVMAPGHVPIWFPIEWYVHAAYPRTEPGINVRNHLHPDWALFSPWHAEAMEAEDEFLGLMCDRYNSDTVRVIYAFSASGETFLPPGHRAFFDPAAKRAFRERFGHDFIIGTHQDKLTSHQPKDPATDELCRWIQDAALETTIRQQLILLSHQPDADVWVLEHPIFEFWQGMWDSGNCVERVYDAMWDLGAENVHAVNFTHYAHGPRWLSVVVPMIHRHKVQMWTGPEYCEGLRVNRREGVMSNMRGMVPCPNHEFLDHENGIEPWMAEELRLTVEAFKRRDGYG